MGLGGGVMYQLADKGVWCSECLCLCLCVCVFVCIKKMTGGEWDYVGVAVK